MTDDMTNFDPPRPHDDRNSYAVALGWNRDIDGWTDHHHDYLNGEADGLQGEGGGVPVFGIRVSRCLSPNGADIVCVVDGPEVNSSDLFGLLGPLMEKVQEGYKRDRSRYEG